MITIDQREELTLIKANVTDFSDSLGYCEHKIPFHMEGIKAPPSPETIRGTNAHKQEEEFEKEHFKFVPITHTELADMNRDIELARENIFTRLLVPTKIGQLRVLVLLFGRADKIFRHRQTLVVQDDKFATNLKKYEERFEPYPDQMLQALAYLNSKFTANGSWKQDEWFEIPHKEKAWIIQIRDKNNESKPFRIFKGVQTEEVKMFFQGSLARFVMLVLGKEERMHHNKPDKCAPCRYFDKCQFRLEPTK